MGITSMIHFSMDIEIPSKIDACCNSHENLMVLNQNTVYCSALIVLAEIASAKVLIFVLALREIETSSEYLHNLQHRTKTEVYGQTGNHKS